jgi:AraC-like DNA-binding protein
MAISAAWTFSDPDAYEKTVRAAQVTGFVIHKRGQFGASLERLNIGRVWTQHGVERLPRSAHLAPDTRRSPIVFLDDEYVLPIVDSGLEVTNDRLIFYGAGATTFQRTDGPTRWSSMSLSPEDLDEAGRVLLDKAVCAPGETRTIRPRPEMLKALRALHRSTNQIARDQPEVVSHPEIERAMEADLVLAMMRCLDGEVDPLPRRHYRHLVIIRQFREWLELNCNRPVYLQEVCDALGVTARTLRDCCQEHLGMGPIRYLWLRRMELARRALLQASRGSATVTKIAMELGFWELGRFSVSYRTLFGEHPSHTLGR